ncbi:NAD(P)H-binding protein [Streptomyces indonesiensis]
MRIAVLGATGRTGRTVVEQALARGHQVVALVRSARSVRRLRSQCRRSGRDQAGRGRLTGCVSRPLRRRCRHLRPRCQQG